MFVRLFQISMKLQQHKLISRDITKLVNSEQSRNLERVLHSVNKVCAFIAITIHYHEYGGNQFFMV